jgi:hypothetical protein
VQLADERIALGTVWRYRATARADDSDQRVVELFDLVGCLLRLILGPVRLGQFVHYLAEAVEIGERPDRVPFGGQPGLVEDLPPADRPRRELLFVLGEECRGLGQFRLLSGDPFHSGGTVTGRGGLLGKPGLGDFPQLG